MNDGLIEETLRIVAEIGKCKRRRLRQKYHLPVVMLTARADAMDMVIGLEVAVRKNKEPLDGA